MAADVRVIVHFKRLEEDAELQEAVDGAYDDCTRGGSDADRYLVAFRGCSR